MTTATLSGDITTTVDATTGLTDTSYVRTSYLFGSILRDTVAMLNAGLVASNAGRGPYIWTFSATGMTDSAVGRFEDLYASTAGSTITFTDLRKFRSESVPITLVSLSHSVVTTSDTLASTTGTSILVMTNGLSSTTTTS